MSTCLETKEWTFYWVFIAFMRLNSLLKDESTEKFKKIPNWLMIKTYDIVIEGTQLKQFFTQKFVAVGASIRKNETFYNQLTSNC